MRRTDGGVVVTSGIYRIFEPPRRLFSPGLEDESGARGHENRGRGELRGGAGGTRVVLLQRRFESSRRATSHCRLVAFDRLTKIVG